VEADEELHTEARLELGANLEASSRMMNRGFDMKVMKTVAVAAALAGCVACGGNGEEVPAVEQQTVTPPQATAMPERVRGCLGAGETEGTYVLTAGAVDTRTDAATYHLQGDLGQLAAHVGRRVEVEGTVVSEQVAQSRGLPMRAAEGGDEPEEVGTSGQGSTPVVQSSTEIEVKRLQVSSVTPIDADCGDER